MQYSVTGFELLFFSGLSYFSFFLNIVFSCDSHPPSSLSSFVPRPPKYVRMLRRGAETLQTRHTLRCFRQTDKNNPHVLNAPRFVETLTS